MVARFLTDGQCTHPVHTLTHTHIHTPIYYSFSQKGRICCQHIILLPLLSSPLLHIYVDAFEDDKLLFFNLPSARLLPSHSFLWSTQTSHRVQACRDAGCTEPRLWLQALWLALQLATRLSGFTLSEPQSLYLYFICYHSEE